jgi:hypothetical protein
MRKKYKLFYKSKDNLPGHWKTEHKSGRYGTESPLKKYVISFLEDGAKDGYFYLLDERFSFSVEDFAVFNPEGKIVVIKTKYGKTMRERNKENVDREINQLNKRERSILSKNLRIGWQFKPGNVWKNFYRKPGESEPQIYANINIKKVTNRVYSKFGIELFVCNVLKDTGLPIKEGHYGKGKFWTALQAKKKIDELMCEIDKSCKRWFYCAWDKKIDGVKWFCGEKEISEKEYSAQRRALSEISVREKA